MITSDRSYFADLIDLCFSNKGSTSNWISHYLNEKGITCEAFNSSVYFRKRHEVLDRFKRGEVKILSCTDLASRGEYYLYRCLLLALNMKLAKLFRSYRQ